MAQVYGDGRCGDNGAMTTGNQLDDTLAAVLARELARWGVPGAVAGVLRPGAPLLVRAAGVTSLADPASVQPDTPFRVASITKPVTATVAALLAGGGALQLDAPLADAVPGTRLPAAATAPGITVRRLLAHLSGLECEPAHDLAEHGAGDDALAAAIAAFPALGSLSAPGEVWSYCNSGYWLAGHIAALAAAMPFEAAVDELMLRPLGMASSGFVHDGVVPPGAAVGHQAAGPGDLAHAVVPGYRFARARVPSGGLVSTVPDLLRFAAAHLDGGHPAATALATLRDPLADGVGVRWGTGWALDRIGGTDLVLHSGSFGGFQSQLVLVPGHGVAVAVLTNSSRGSAVVRAVVEHVLEAACGLRRPNPVAVAVDTVPLAGRYRAAGLTVDARPTAAGIEVTQRTRTPAGAETALPPLHGIPVAADPPRFVVPDGEARGAQFDFPGPGRIRVSGRLALREP